MSIGTTTFIIEALDKTVVVFFFYKKGEKASFKGSDDDQHVKAFGAGL